MPEELLNYIDWTGVSRPIVGVSIVGGGSVFGSPDDAAWNGTDPEATVISLLKAIALNTAP